MEEWKQYRLIEVLEALIDYRGKTPKKTTSGVPLITAKIIKNGRIETPTEFISVDNYDSWMVRGFPKVGDVVLTTEAPLGEVAQLDDANIALAQRVVTLRGKSDVLDNTYLKYYFMSNVGKQRLKARETGTTVTGIKQSELKEVLVDVPPYKVQVRIAEVLKSLDDKIELNRRINDNFIYQKLIEIISIWKITTLLNDNLEKLIKNIFNSWKESINHIPNKLVALNSIADFISGYSYKGKELQKSETAMATIKNFDRKGGFKLDGFKEICVSGNIKPGQYASLFDILVAHTDLTQNAEVIGNTELILSLNGYKNIIFSMDLVKVIPKKTFPYRFTLATLLRDYKFKSHSLGYVNGTTVLHLNKKALPDYIINLPLKDNLLFEVEQKLSVLYHKLAEIIAENEKLKLIRDQILPKLMSGELKPSDLTL